MNLGGRPDWGQVFTISFWGRALRAAALAAAVAAVVVGCVRPPEAADGPNDGSLLEANERLASITFVSHATTLIQTGGLNILTDPYYVQAGHYEPVGVGWEDLPEIDLVLISHVHMDHLNRQSLFRLPSTATLIAPAGVAPFLADEEIQPKIVLLKPGQSHTVGEVTIAAEEIFHPSRRMVFWGRDTGTLGYVIKGPGYNVLFVGDSGPRTEYYDVIAERHRVDVAVLPIGPRSHVFHRNHQWPEDAVDAFERTGASVMIPVHWRSRRKLTDPRHTTNILRREAARRGLAENVIVLGHGDTLFLAPRRPGDPVNRRTRELAGAG